ncbi:MAG: phosphoribosylanthranilate isomerase [Rhodospirillales bacterium]
MPVTVKICGLSRPAEVQAASAAGADMVGFVFFARSPRAVSPVQAAALAAHAGEGIIRVGLIVDADDAMVDAVTASGAVNMLQLHGAETPGRTAEIRARSGLPVMKVLAAEKAADIARAADYADAADRFLFDAKPPPGASRPGGNAASFDWGLLADAASAPASASVLTARPWLLAGGLTPENAAEAIRVSGAPGVDVSSGVESGPGVKDLGLIRAFIAAARGA